MRRTSSTIVPAVVISREINDTAYDNIKVIVANIDTIQDVADALADDAFGIAADNVAVIQTVAGLANEIQAVANGMAGIESIEPYLVEIGLVAGNIGAVQAIGANIAKIVDVHSMLDAVVDVAADLELVDSKIATVAEAMDAIEIVATSNDNIDVVANDIQNINTVHANLDKIDTVYTDRLKISTVADNMIPVIWLWQHRHVIEDIALIGTDRLASITDNMDSIITVSDNIAIVEAVATDMTNVNIVAENIADVNTVVNNISDVVEVADNITDVEIVANDLMLAGYTHLLDLGSIDEPAESPATGVSHIETVSTNMEDVVTVSTDIASVVAVANSIANVDEVVATVVPNMAEILLADDNAAIATSKAAEASASEEMAYKWAQEAEDVIVQGTLGVDDEYSAYHWAKKAEAAAGGSVELNTLYDVNTAGVVDKQVIAYDEDGTPDQKWVPVTVDKVYVGLDQVDNTSDETKWAAVATVTNKVIDDITNTVGADHIHYKVRNNTGSTLAKGTVVKATGTQPGTDYIVVEPTTSTQDVGIGVVHSDISGDTGWIGLVINTGVVDKTNTSAWPVGTILYTGSGGTWTTTKPTSGTYQASAYVLRQHVTQGTLLVEFTEPRSTVSQIVSEITVVDCGDIP